MKFSTLTVRIVRRPGEAGCVATYELVRPDAEASEHLGEGLITLPPVIPPLGREEDLAAYTRELSGAVFGGERGSKALLSARLVAETLTYPLRVRVAIGKDPELGRHHWELLADPEKDLRPLAWGERSCFCRYLPSDKVRTPPRPPTRLRSVALVADPQNVELHRVNVSAEKALISDALDRTRINRLYGARATLDELLRAMGEGADIVYLACHGRLVDGKPYLYLENERREASIVDATLLADRLDAMKRLPPRLVVLASCDSAGTGIADPDGDGGFFASAATALIQAGVPAVIGMQGAVAQDTSHVFVKAFFRQLLDHGQVELATAAARMEIPRQADWWVASLLLAVDDGVLWAGGPPREFPHWDELLESVDRQECTAILGSEVIERFSNRRLAQYFTKKLRHRPRPGSAVDLARISQQLKVENTSPSNSLRGFYRSIQAEDRIANPEPDLAKSVSRWAEQTLAPPEFNPYRELARLPIPLFLTTNPDDLLTDALSAKKTPQIMVCPWKDDEPGQRGDMPHTIRPTAAEPVVFHLFGHLSDPQSVVLTEDDFFDHLIWVSRHAPRTIPPSVIAHLAQTSLLFLGFQLEDWEFRVLLRNFVRMQIVEMLAGRLHVAVQLDPTELTPEQQADAQRALEEHFSNTEVHLAIYWGSVEDFLREMRREREKRSSIATVGAGAQP